MRASAASVARADKIAAQKTRRLVLDSVGHIMGVDANEGISELLAALGARFKALGVTSMFTHEASSLYATDPMTDRGFSAITDNLITLRYADRFGEARPALSVIKTRGSAHDRGTHLFSIKQGGIEVKNRALHRSTARSERLSSESRRRASGANRGGEDDQSKSPNGEAPQDPRRVATAW